ncbi:MAG: hypothetical protein Q9162_007192 [Coniocarpon cinnabarinum]
MAYTPPGAGAGGTSCAYHLRQYADEGGLPLELSIYERNSYIGGRSTTVNAYENSTYPVELGGSIFVSVNHILQDALRTFNLSTTHELDEDDEDADNLLGVWDGSSFLLTHQTNTPSNPLEGWWRQLRILLRFGMAPIRVRSLVKNVVNRFLKMYEWPLFPFSNLTKVVQTISLDSVASSTSWNYLKQNSLDGNFAWVLHQAATRVNYASDLDDIHAVEGMVSMATSGAVSVAGGNWQIFAGMAEASHASLLLERQVEQVVKTEDGGFIIKTNNTQTTQSDKYDAVVLAAPYHQTNIDWSDARLIHSPQDDPYRKLHVTLFTTALPLSRAYFNLSLLDAVPTTVLTTLPACAQPPGKLSCTDRYPSFQSISTLRSTVNPTTGRPERLYKIFTLEEPVSDDFLATLFDLELSTDGHVSKGDISWIYRKTWLSYPLEYPRDEFEPIRLDDAMDGGGGLWYTGAMEGFISTMETNALMGKNVARLMMDKWTGSEDQLPVKEQEREMKSAESMSYEL